MQQPPKLFDLDALAAHRARADDASSDIWYLHDRAIDIVSEKLKDINRSFTDIAIVGPRGQAWADALGISATCVPDTDTLNLATDSFDLVIHAMALHWSNDPIGQLVQMRRALRPDGLMITATFGGQTLQELRIAFAQAEAAVMGGISPRVVPMGEIRDMGGLLQRASFALPVADNDLVTVSYGSTLNLMSELRRMGETNAMHARLKTPMRRDLLAAVAHEYADAFSDGAGRLSATFELVFLTGWAPSDDQQKPLRPGSAKTRLSDALGVPELFPEKN